MMDQLKLPEYCIPKDLEMVLYQEWAVLSFSNRAQIFSQILETLKIINFLDISECHYLQLLKLALYIEEYKAMNNMKVHVLFDKKLARLKKKSPLKFNIPLNDMTEVKLIIKPNDFVDVIDIIDNCKVYTLRVTEITENCITAIDDKHEKFCKAYNSKKSYNIEFRYNNYANKCAHFALWLMNERNSVTYLFPLKSKPFIRDNEVVDFRRKRADSNFEKNNVEQKQAIMNIISKSSFPAPYILCGPPGTGKTATLVNAIYQLYRYFPDRNILVCTPTDIQADDITERLLQYSIPRKDMYRACSQFRSVLSINKKVRKKKFVNCEGDVMIPIKYEDVVNKRIVITTLRDCMSLLLIGIEENYFSYVFIDEASCVTEPDILIPVSLISCGGSINSQIVLAGDPLQLGPNFRSIISKTIMGRSIIERLMSYEIYQKDDNNKYNPKYITKLFQNYRYHPDTIHVSNKLFYNNELIPIREKHANDRFPIIFYGVEGEEKRPDNNSFYNADEIEAVIDNIIDLYNNRLNVGKVAPEDIGIITPFPYQSKKIKKQLKHRHFQGISVGTIDFFQEHKRRIIILSTVRSKTSTGDDPKHIGSLSDPKCFNFIMTKATDLLIVVGNPNVLQKDEKWLCLIKFCQDNNSYAGSEFSLDDDVFKEQDSSFMSTSAIDSTSLFDENVLKLFTLDEYNPEIDPVQIPKLSLDSTYENLVNPVENWNMHSIENDNDNDCSSEKPIFEDQIQCKVLSPSISETDILQNTSLVGTSDQTVKFSNSKEESSNQQDILTETADCEDICPEKCENKSASEKLHTPQKDKLETNISNNFSKSDHKDFIDSGVSEKYSDKQDDNFKSASDSYQMKELENLNVLTKSFDTEKEVREVDSLKNASDFFDVKIQDLPEIDVVIPANNSSLIRSKDSSNFQVSFEKQVLLFETDRIRKKNRSDHLKLENLNILEKSHEKPKDSFDNNSDSMKSKEFSEFHELCEKQKDPHVAVENVGDILLEDPGASNNIYSNQISYSGNDKKSDYSEFSDSDFTTVFLTDSQSDHMELDDSRIMKKLLEKQEDFLSEVSNCKNKQRDDRMEVKDLNVLENLPDEEKYKLSEAISSQNSNISNLSKFSESDSASISDDNKGYLMKNSISEDAKDIEHPGMAIISTDSQKDLIDFGSVVENDNSSDLIEF